MVKMGFLACGGGAGVEVGSGGVEVGWKGTGGVGVGGEGWYRVVCRVLLMRVHGEFGEPGACAVFGKREKDKSGDMWC